MDPVLRPEELAGQGASYRGGVPADSPLVSPLFGDLSGLPRLLMQVGTHEVLHDDTIRFAERARAAGADVEVQIEDGMPHCHQMILWRLPEAVDSIR
jgi:epsilon-lactone hydrolase